MGYADKERGAEDSGGNWERSFGMIYVIALSPDDRFLAVGGVFSESTIENIDMGLIRRLTSLSKPLSVNKPPKGAFFTAEAARRTEMK
jgi:hypothetical protein